MLQECCVVVARSDGSVLSALLRKWLSVMRIGLKERLQHSRLLWGGDMGDTITSSKTLAWLAAPTNNVSFPTLYYCCVPTIDTFQCIVSKSKMSKESDTSVSRRKKQIQGGKGIIKSSCEKVRPVTYARKKCINWKCSFGFLDGVKIELNSYPLPDSELRPIKPRKMLHLWTSRVLVV